MNQEPQVTGDWPEGTTCEDIGAKIGDTFTVAVSDWSLNGNYIGKTVTLHADDGSHRPMFRLHNGDTYFMYISNLTNHVKVSRDE